MFYGLEGDGETCGYELGCLALFPAVGGGGSTRPTARRLGVRNPGFSPYAAVLTTFCGLGEPLRRRGSFPFSFFFLSFPPFNF